MNWEPPQLSEYCESMLALGMSGGVFADHAASQLLRDRSCWSEVRYWMLRSALNRQDKRAVRIYLHDWAKMDHRPKARVSKWIPGEHFYALDNKFSTLQEACEYINKMGYQFSGLYEQRIYDD